MKERIITLASKPAVRWLAAGLLFVGLNALFLKVYVGMLGLSVAIGSIAAAETSTLLRFLINDRWVFGHRRPSWRRLLEYHAAQAGGFFIWWAATNVLNYFGMHYLLAGTAAIAFSTGFSFLTNFHWVWRRAKAGGGNMGTRDRVQGSKDEKPVSPVSLYQVPLDRKVVCGIVVLREDGAALLQHRDDIPTIADPGLWVFPGGHVEPGETPVAGAVREVEEETCYRSGEPRHLASYSAAELGYEGDFQMIFYWDTYDGRQAIECREGQDARFVRREEATSLPCRDYLTRVWDLALAKRKAC